MKRYLLSSLLVLASAASAWSQANTTVNWSNFSFDVQDDVLLRNVAGTPLSQGTGANNDGVLVQLGYYSDGTAANPFAGAWIPLTGAFGTSFPTTVGDAGSGTTGSGDGVIDFISSFTLNTRNVVVYPGAENAYTTQSSIDITTSAPANGRILSIRFYDNTTGQMGFYNAVSTADWQWQTPTTVGGGAVVNLFIADAFADGPGGSLADLVWEGGDGSAFRTFIAVPEPSTYALLAAGIGMFAIARRRRKQAAN